MSIKTFTAGSVLTASDTNTYLANSGLVYISTTTIPASPAQSSINVTSCFSSTYDNYLIVASGITTTGVGSTLNYKLLSGSTPTTAGFYGNTFYIQSGVAGALTNAPFSNTANGEMCSATAASVTYAVMQLQAPYVAQYTRSQHMSADSLYLRWNSMVHTSATSYDGIQILPSAGTFNSGTITVYGYRKA